MATKSLLHQSTNLTTRQYPQIDSYVEALCIHFNYGLFDSFGTQLSSGIVSAQVSPDNSNLIAYKYMVLSRAYKLNKREGKSGNCVRRTKNVYIYFNSQHNTLFFFKTLLKSNKPVSSPLHRFPTFLSRRLEIRGKSVLISNAHIYIRTRIHRKVHTDFYAVIAHLCTSRRSCFFFL